jgi:uncharacterized protein (TIRG00374 family)
VLLVFVLWFIVLPQFAAARQALLDIRDINVALLSTGVALEALSLYCYAQITRTVLDPSTLPSLWKVARINLAGITVSNVVPAGGALSLGVRFRYLAKAGVQRSTIVGALAVEIVVIYLVLGLLFAIGVVFSIATLPPSPYYQAAGVFVVAVFGTAAVLIGLAVRDPERALAVVRRVTRERWRDRVEGAARSLLTGLAVDRRRIARATAWAAFNLTLDAAALWVLLAAFGYRPAPAHLLLLYTLVGILAIPPITPGGLGVIEGVLVPGLVSIGAAFGPAVLGVTAWRLVQYWGPTAVGAIAAVSLMSSTRRTLETAAEDAV